MDIGGRATQEQLPSSYRAVTEAAKDAEFFICILRRRRNIQIYVFLRVLCASAVDAFIFYLSEIYY